MPRKRKRQRFSLRGVIHAQGDPAKPLLLHAADPVAAQKALKGFPGIVLANPPNIQKPRRRGARPETCTGKP